MILNPEDIKKIAHLARIAITEEDIVSLTKDLSNILNLVEQMGKVNTDCVTPMAHPYDESQPLREDIVTEHDQRQLFQSIAPQTTAGLYIVPQVIDSE